MPALTADEINYLLGSSDYYGLNHYSSVYVFRNESVIGLHESPSYDDDIEAGTFRLDEWKISPTSSVNVSLLQSHFFDFCLVDFGNFNELARTLFVQFHVSKE